MERVIPLNSVHPAIRDRVAQLDNFIDSPQGIFCRYPILVPMLAAQRDYLADREQISANDWVNKDTVKGFMRGEGWEVVDVLGRSIRKGLGYVDGQVSKEGIDWGIFASLYAALRIIDDGDISKMEQAEIALGLAGMRAIEMAFSKVNFLAELAGKVRINEINWPRRVLKGPHSWDMYQLAEFYQAESRPKLKVLRTSMPDGQRLLYPEVAQAIEDKQVVPPEIEGANDNYYIAYNGVIGLIEKIEQEDGSVPV